ncbi:MAG: tRNA (adenosine(37)-N6)-threonylcarbamoyltransferase complex ATPase subunit type 1 TsaE [Nitriliruptoraceae bacterium]
MKAGADRNGRDAGHDAQDAGADDADNRHLPGTRLTLTTSTPEDTQQVAAVVASQIEPGDVIVLGGELGAGKTCFVQGAARHLGVTGRVTSPTFTLIRSYPQATPPIVHVDIYRLDRLHDVVDLGDEVFDPQSVTFIEWGDAAASLLPDDRLDVEMLLVDPQDVDAERQITLHGYGSWAARLSLLDGPLGNRRDGPATDRGNLGATGSAAAEIQAAGLDAADAEAAGSNGAGMDSPDTGTDT